MYDMTVQLRTRLAELVYKYAERDRDRAAALDRWRANGDVGYADLADYDEARADNDAEAANDLAELLDELRKIAAMEE